MNILQEKLKEVLENGKLNYHFIEVMNCPGGCVGGGGQPLGVNSKQKETNERRISGLYEEDEGPCGAGAFQLCGQVQGK